MFDIIPLILILVSLTIIISIVVKKFSILVSLDVDSMQAEREARFKEQIISNRLKRNYLRYYTRVVKLIQPVGQALGDFFRWLHKSLIDFKENYNKEKIAEVDIDQTIEKLFLETEELIKNEDLDSAEKKFIDIIGLDSKNIRAFRGLGDLYFLRKNFNEAKQTFEHALKLLQKDSVETGNYIESGESTEDINSQITDIYYDIALVCKEIGVLSDALGSIDKALEIEPNNPRYLDTKLEISIIKKDKGAALSAYEKLKEANPENQKLDEFKQQIDEI